MSVGSSAYQLLISPIELLLETIYGVAGLVRESAGFCIFAMSMVMNVLLLPLYNQADALQAKERDIEKSMEPYVKHIRKTFSGDERFMMLQTYYNQAHYKPYYTLRGSLPLLLEVPFFIAAYHFLSHLAELQHTPLGPIADLGAPDGLLVLGSVTLNALPILMTAINVVSSAVYTKGAPLKSKLTLYGVALIFLVLLYNSPSGLVFYWTLNNLFSLFKNLFYKLKNPRKILRLLLAAGGAALLIFTLFFAALDNPPLEALLVVIALAMELPLLLRLCKNKKPLLPAFSGANYRLFLLGGLFLAVLTGVLIPSAVVASSPEEFVQLSDFYSPNVHVLNAALCAVGTFVIWLGVFYYLSGPRLRKLLDGGIWLFSVLAVVDYMFFGTHMGEMSAELIYDSNSLYSLTSLFSPRDVLVNLAVLLLAAIPLVFLFVKKPRLVKTAYAVLLIAIVCMSGANIVQIQRAVPGLKQSAADMQESERAHFSLSKNGKNVVVLMLDRAINSYIPYMFQENPQLAEQFAGFTYYPNTLSFGDHTSFAVPSLFGGYEYTPDELNKRSDEWLVDKHDEALKLMPVLFSEAGYEVTVCDPPFAGYRWIPNLHIYDDYPEIHTYNTENGQFFYGTQEELQHVIAQRNRLWKRDFFCYSLMKVSPLAIQGKLYHGGTYYMKAYADDPSVTQSAEDLSRAEGLDRDFMNSYAVLNALPDITLIAEDGNTFLMLQNSTTHAPTLLAEPSYTPAAVIDNAEYDAAHRDRFTYEGREMRVASITQMATYHVNMAALMKVGAWLDYLRANGVYDNTRIIIVADHGHRMGQFDDLLFGDTIYDDIMYFNPLLLVKDFGSDTLTTDDSFMTNADVPTLAMEDLIADPVNPFTGKPVNSDAKLAGDQIVMKSIIWQPTENQGKTFLPAVWYAVRDDIFDLNNWNKLGEW